MEYQVDSINLANYIIKRMAEKGKRIDHLKLQKLLFYVAAWHLVYTNTPIIKEDFEAWLHGPVLRKVWNYFKQYSTMFEILPIEDSNDIQLTEEQKEIIDDVLDEYGDKSGYYLECLTHSEEPWKIARSLGENSIIDKDKIKKYYSRLLDVK